LRGKVQKVQAHTALRTQELPITHTWSHDLQEWVVLGSPTINSNNTTTPTATTPTSETKEVPPLCLHVEDLPAMVTWFFSTSRKSADTQVRIMRRLFPPTTDVQTLTRVSIEQTYLSALEEACPFPLVRQYTLDRFRLDAFIPRLRIAIEIDEHGHQGYDPANERAKETVLRDHNIVLLRCNPHVANPHAGAEETQMHSILKLVRQMWSRTLDPDFKLFWKENQLG
jgi:very-short-patch-repair endonuclease